MSESDNLKDIVVRPSTDDPSSRVKPAPKKTSIPVPFSYAPSDDGTDQNLLILLHGLGDTHVPFANLGRQLHLPQTATLSLRAPEQIPYLYEEAYQWYTSFDDLGELIVRPDPTPALDLLANVIDHLVRDCTWPPPKIHLFGFMQGGSLASEVVLNWWKTQLMKAGKDSGLPSGSGNGTALGSVVTISGPLLSYPTVSIPCPTPVLVFHRLPPAESSLASGSLTAFKKGFNTVVEVKLGAHDGMPRSKDEWEPIMRFWSERLGRRQVDGLYEVMSGMAG